ncbi:hypothetical protein JCM3774_003378 [Rhodotorula dairenensis]
MESRVKQEDAHNDSPSGSAPSVTDSPLPTSGDYNDFLLRSSAPPSDSGWKYNVMKFTAVGDRVIDPADESLFLRPVKLNRKDPRTVRRLTDEDRERHNKRALERAAKAAGSSDLGAGAMDVDEAKPGEVKAEDGSAEEGGGADKEELDPELVGKGVDGTTTVQRRGPRGQFKKKFQRVYVASEEARRLKREEWQPWVLEDDEGRERWVGRLEGGAGEIGGGGGANKNGGAASTQGRIAPSTSTGTGARTASLDGWRPAAEASATGGGGSAYVAFVFGDNGDEFKVVPINRWYRFNQGPKYLTLAEEEAEAEYARQQKSKEHERWTMRRRAAPTSAPASGSATPRAGTSGQTVATASSLRSRMLERSTVGTKPDPDGGDLDDLGRPRIRTVISSTSGGAGGGGSDSLRGRKGPRRRGGQDQDDDEFDYEEDFQDDEEGIAKIDDLADEEETRELEERIRREMRAVERPDAIPDEPADDDDDRLTGTGKEIKKLVRKSDKTGLYESDDDDDDNPYASSDAESDGAASTASADRAERGSGSRPSTPRPGSPSGHYRSGSVSSRGPSRAGSPSSGAAYLAKRATSPAPSASLSGAAAAGKRKRDRASTTDGAASDSDADGSKRRKAGGGGGGKSPSPAPGPPAGAVLTQADIVAYLKTRPNQTSTTKEVLTHFRKAIKGDARNKASIGGLLRAAANLVDGNLVLKPGL